MRSCIERVQVHLERIDIVLDQDRVCWCLDETADKPKPLEKTPQANRQLTTLSIPARLKRTGKEMRIIIDDGSVLLYRGRLLLKCPRWYLSNDWCKPEGLALLVPIER